MRAVRRGARAQDAVRCVHGSGALAVLLLPFLASSTYLASSRSPELTLTHPSPRSQSEGGKKKKSAQLAPTHEDTEHILSLLSSLFTSLSSDTPLRTRLLAKFVESDYEKVDRLCEVREELERRIDKGVDPALAADMDDDELYLDKLDNGLFALQLADYVAAWVCMEDDGVRPFSPSPSSSSSPPSPRLTVSPASVPLCRRATTSRCSSLAATSRCATSSPSSTSTATTSASTTTCPRTRRRARVRSAGPSSTSSRGTSRASRSVLYRATRSLRPVLLFSSAERAREKGEPAWLSAAGRPGQASSSVCREPL